MGVRSTNSKLVLQKVKGQTVQGQTAQEFGLFSADPQCPLFHLILIEPGKVILVQPCITFTFACSCRSYEGHMSPHLLEVFLYNIRSVT